MGLFLAARRTGRKTGKSKRRLVIQKVGTEFLVELVVTSAIVPGVRAPVERMELYRRQMDPGETLKRAGSVLHAAILCGALLEHERLISSTSRSQRGIGLRAMTSKDAEKLRALGYLQ